MTQERIEEIQELLWSTWENGDIPDNDFYALQRELEESLVVSYDPECAFLLSEMFLHRSNTCKRYAAQYAHEGLAHTADHTGLHSNYAIANNRASFDFKHCNHNKLIDFYYDYIVRYPETLIARRILIEALLDNYRLDEARQQIADALRIAGKRSFLIEFYTGDVFFKEGNHDAALGYWQSICEQNPNNAVCVFLLAESYAKYGRYDEAIIYYRKNADLQSYPRKIDAHITLVQLYEIQKKYREALTVLDEILTIYKEDYEVSDGDEIAPYIADRSRIASYIKNR